MIGPVISVSKFKTPLRLDTSSFSIRLFKQINYFYVIVVVHVSGKFSCYQLEHPLSLFQPNQLNRNILKNPPVPSKNIRYGFFSQTDFPRAWLTFSMCMYVCVSVVWACLSRIGRANRIHRINIICARMSPQKRHTTRRICCPNERKRRESVMSPVWSDFGANCLLTKIDRRAIWVKQSELNWF